MGAGQVLRGTRTPLALSQRLSPAPTQCPCVQPLGKVPVPFRQGLGTLLQPHLWGHGPPRGQAHPEAFWCPFGVPWQNCNPTAGWRRGLVPSPSTRDWGASQRFIYLGTNSLFQAFFCSSLFNPSLTRAHSHAFLRQEHVSAPRSILKTLPSYFALWVLAGAATPPHLCRGRRSPRGPLGFILHLPEIKPGLFLTNSDPLSASLWCCCRGAVLVPPSPGTGVAGGPARCLNKSRAPPWKPRSITGKHNRLR